MCVPVNCRDGHLAVTAVPRVARNCSKTLCGRLRQAREQSCVLHKYGHRVRDHERF